MFFDYGVSLARQQSHNCHTENKRFRKVPQSEENTLQAIHPQKHLSYCFGGNLMVRWIKLYGQQYFGFWVLGLVLFAFQEIPYMLILLRCIM